VFKICVLEKRSKIQRDWIPCVVGEHIIFRPDVLRSYCFAPWDPIIYDLLLVAAIVNFCDWSFKRSAVCWERAFEVRVPVHEPARWNETAVLNALHRVLQLLTGDRWSIVFVARKRAYEPPTEQSLPISTNSRAVMAFSNGLDSYSVAGWFVAENGDDSLVRVRVGRGDKTRPRKLPFTAVPFRVRPVGNSHETSGRGRGFKFAATSGLAASLSNVSEIIVPESGSGALGPVLVRFNRMYSDFRNHPKFFRQMEVFLGAMLNRQLTFKQPRLESTKGESLRTYLEHAQIKRSAAAVQALVETRSCWQNRHYVAVESIRRQCGICASCMLRRLSMHVAGIKEPEETYSWENLNAPDLVAAAPAEYKEKIGCAIENYAIAGTLHLAHLARLRSSYDYADITARHAREIADATGSDQATVKRWLDEFLQRHEVQWRSFLAALSAGSFVKQWAGSP
jgi:7-cyano-7-deazaguanine synthase in queuosine biosynthesis